jgi:hypothetical protein
MVYLGPIYSAGPLVVNYWWLGLMCMKHFEYISKKAENKKENKKTLTHVIYIIRTLDAGRISVT